MEKTPADRLKYVRRRLDFEQDGASSPPRLYYDDLEGVEPLPTNGSAGTETRDKEATNGEGGRRDVADLEMRQQRQEATERWNFDFENGVPLQGDWEWERVAPSQPLEQKTVAEAIEKEKDRNRNV